MRLSIVAIGVLLLLIGIGTIAYAEARYHAKMNELEEMRRELNELRAIAEEKYIETGDPYYLSKIAEIETLYSETFYIEGQIRSSRNLGQMAGIPLIFFGVIVLILGIASKGEKPEVLCSPAS